MERERKGRMGKGTEIEEGQTREWRLGMGRQEDGQIRGQIWAWVDKRTENRDKWTWKKRLGRPVMGQRLRIHK